MVSGIDDRRNGGIGRNLLEVDKPAACEIYRPCQKRCRLLLFIFSRHWLDCTVLYCTLLLADKYSIDLTNRKNEDREI